MITQHNVQSTFTKELQNGHQHIQLDLKWSYTYTNKLDRGKNKYLFYPKHPKHPEDQQLF